jgi:thioester reductase-like protein
MNKSGIGVEMDKTIFITGATGNIGGKIVIRILKDDPSAQLILLIRGQNEAEIRRRLSANIRILEPDFDFEQCRQNIRIACGDITEENLGLSDNIRKELTTKVTHIIHSAAATQFTLPLVCARQINYFGTMNVMAFAREIKSLGIPVQVTYISTAFVCGTNNGIVGENELPKPKRFANTYEQTKWEAEKYVRTLMPKLPITVFRPSIVVGDSITGRTLAFNVMYTPLHYIYRGALSIIPCDSNNSLDVVPLDYVADSICQIFLKGRDSAGHTYNIVAGDRAESVGNIVEYATRYFNLNNHHQSINHIRFISPLLYHSLYHFFRGKMRRMADIFEIYESYICARREFDDTNTRVALRGSGINVSEMKSYFINILDFCIKSNWGKRMKQAG